MISAQWGQNTNVTAYAQNVAPEYDDYVEEFYAARELLAKGYPTYLLTSLPANSAWWFGDPYDSHTGIRLHRAASSVKPWDIATPDFDQGFVAETPVAYTSVAVTRPNMWALVDPTDDYVEGDVPIWAQPVPVTPDPYYLYSSMSGGW